MSARENELKKELGATLEARKELGDEYESALIESFLDKLDTRLESQVEQKVRRGLAERTTSSHRPPEQPKRPFQDSLPYVSLAFAIPLSAIGGEAGGLPGLLISWLGIVGVNVAAFWHRR
ncbi:hypothetical protein AQ490_23085 [Wenjunlia vitaminophila]|uniref:Integral membrane protein n=1 Tax=Wenjunlia vitaminophila TaxID=76728 RepID=A0A0T6LRK3_WENVI|nr:hypothetical protein [Wenjunlia vitaminophila]KRV48759.1 hypothetical protein AQ490_23085 [Wenjunlia vitaminophila]